MSEIAFEWDDSKNRANQRKHGVSFDEAKSVFFDENAIEFPDPDYERGDDRFLMVGHSFRLRLLLICHCYRANDSVVRIISARKATAKERAAYVSEE